MPEEPSPALIKFVRRTVRRSPELLLEEVVDRWRAQHPETGEVDFLALRAVYEEARTANRGPPPRHPHHSRIVVLTIVAWIVAHGLLLAALTLPSYFECRGLPISSQGFFGCSLTAGLVSLVFGAVQLFYGLIAGAVLSSRRPAIAQGLFIGSAIVAATFTVLCFSTPAILR